MGCELCVQPMNCISEMKLVWVILMLRFKVVVAPLTAVDGGVRRTPRQPCARNGVCGRLRDPHVDCW